MEVTFVFLDSPYNDLSKCNITDSLTVKKDLADDDSVTDIAKVIAKKYSKCKQGNNESSEDVPVILFFNPVDGQDLYSTSPDYYFNEKNEVIFLDFYEKFTHNWKLKDFKKMKNSGHIKNDISLVYIAVAQGLGAVDGYEELIKILTSFLLGLFQNFLISSAEGTIRTAILKIKNKDIQKVTEQWVNVQGLRATRKLRLFIVKKGNWELKELAINLNTTQEMAMLLLESLGYELQGNQYMPSYSKEAIQRRLDWERRENLELSE